MHLGERFWTSVTYVVNLITLTPFDDGGANNQAPLLPISDVSVVQATVVPTPLLPVSDVPVVQPAAVSTSLLPVSEVPVVQAAAVPTPDESSREPGPVFVPPSGDPRRHDFKCEYPKMWGWQNCSTPDNRGCWLKNEFDEEINLMTNYEDINETPEGIHRYFHMDVMDGWVNADGVNFTDAKLFNGTYPGPWIEACWGDYIHVTVTNKMKHNGTSIHWHGIRQWLSMHADGVNGVTECPIAPGDSFTYSFRAMQYGSSWYHSHYSVQYADGLHGPMTIHGPSTLGYDEAVNPILMTDWGHSSAFEAIWWGVDKIKYPSILLNGRGNVTRFNEDNDPELPVPKPYKMRFERKKPGQQAKRYLLRLINTSFETTFVFSIDHHKLQVVGADFVPIHNYTNSSILIGIGQRYHVIVEADPWHYCTKAQIQKGTCVHKRVEDNNFWIRTWRAKCFNFATPSRGYEMAGILTYDQNDTKLPVTQSWMHKGSNLPVSLECSDEEYTSLIPYRPWTVGPPANSHEGSLGEDFIVQFVGGQETVYPLAKFSMFENKFDPLRINYGDPSFLHLNYTGKWNPHWVVIPENYTEKDWVYMVIRGVGAKTNQPKNTFGAHPIHLHGHDFAILQYKQNASYPEGLDLKYDNPPRRDVVLLPTNGYVVIAFKADNPGNWLMHCHIAFHASFGLGLQVLERQKDAAALWPDVRKSNELGRAQEGCNNWNKWYGDCKNWWPGDGRHCRDGEQWFSPDSGV